MAEITANVDLTERGRGIVLLAGAHGFPEPPQALLGRRDGKWYAEDSYGDKDRDGVTERPNFFDTDPDRDAVLRKWLRSLGIDPADVEIKTLKEY